MGELKQTCKGCNRDIPLMEEYTCPECGLCILCGNDMDSKECQCYRFDHDWD